jgi:hypothetical protein
MPRILSTEYFFWLVLIGFYFADCVKLIPRDRLLLSENFKGRLNPIFSFHDFELGGRHVFFLNFMAPFFCVFNLRCGVDTELSKNKITRDARRIKLFQRRVRLLRLISLIDLLLIFSGPVLTYLLGFFSAVMLIIPFHLLLYLGMSLVLIKNRKNLNLGSGKLLSVLFESLVVPAYVCNIVQRLSLAQSFIGNGYLYSLQSATEEGREEIEFCIHRKIEQEIDICAAYDPALVAGYERYRATLFGKEVRTK